MITIISSKSAKITAGLVGLVAAVAFASVASAATFTTTLKFGSKGADVKNLQVLLNSDPATQVAATGAGSAGYETTTFGPATKAAVIKFQNKYASDVLKPAGLTKGTGVVGALTRAKLNTMGGTTTTTTTPTATTTTTTTTSGPVSVTLSSDNPAASAVVAGQATADLLHVTFTGNGTLSSVKFQRTGISSNTTLANVYLFNGNTRVSDGAAVDTNGGITFNNLNLAISGSATLSVKADIAAGTAGQIVGVQLVGYTVSGSASMTSASISGNYMNVAGVANMSTVSFGTQTVANANVNAGTMGYTFFSVPVTVSQHAVVLKGATFKYIGSATTDALANVKLYVNGTAVGSAGTINPSTNLLSFDLSSSPFTMNTGASTVEVRADVVKGSNRNVLLSLQNAADLVAMDSQLSVNVAAVTAPSTTTFATVSGGTITINPGSITTTIDPAFNNVTNVTGGATGAVIGRFKLQAYGEDVKVQSLSVTPAFSTAPTPAANGLNNVALFYNGGQVGSSQNMAGTSTALTFQLGSSLIVAAGTTGTLEVRADIQSAASANYTAGTITSSLVLGASNGQGMSSLNLTNVPQATITTTGLTVTTGALSISQAPSYASAQTVNPNTANVKIGSYVLQNTSTSEGVRITNLAVAVGGTQSVTYLSNLRTTETSGSGATPISPAANNNFSVNFTLAPGQSKTIDVMADIGSAVAASTTITTLLPTAVGASSNVTVTPGSPTTGQTITVQTGSVAVPTLNPAPSSLAAQFVVGGVQNLTTSQYNFVATNGVATISELKFAVGGSAMTSTTTPVTTVTVGGVSAPVVSGVAYLTGLNISVPNSPAGANVSVQSSFGTVGTNGVPSNTTATTSLTYMKYTIGGITTSTSTLAIPSNTLTLVGTKPTVTIAGSTDALINGLVKLAEVTVSADAAGDLKLTALPINVTSTGVVTVATTTNIFTIKGTDGTIIPSTTATSSVAAGASSGDVVATITGGYLIPAGTSKTFRIYTTAATVSGAVNTTSLSTKLGASSGMTWTDQVGGVSGITGANIYNFPTDTSVIHN